MYNILNKYNRQICKLTISVKIYMISLIWYSKITIYIPSKNILSLHIVIVKSTSDMRR